MSFQGLVFGVLAAGGAALIVLYIRSLGSSHGERTVQRMAEVEDHRMVSSLEELEMSRPLAERVLIPLRDRIFELISERTPAARQRELRTLLSNAGRPMNLTVPAVMVLKLLAAIVAGAIGIFFLLPLFHLHFPLTILGAALGLGGWILPEQWLKQKAKQRRNLFERDIPDSLDLLTICLDAGLAFDAALAELAGKVKGPMAYELGITLGEIRYGRPRGEAFEEMARRVGAEDWYDFVQALILSQKLGAPISETVRIQSAEIRRRRRQRAEEQAAQASLKMLFPMVGCIFPTLFIVLMGPIALLLLHAH